MGQEKNSADEHCFRHKDIEVPFGIDIRMCLISCVITEEKNILNIVRFGRICTYYKIKNSRCKAHLKTQYEFATDLMGTVTRLNICAGRPLIDDSICF